MSSHSPTRDLAVHRRGGNRLADSSPSPVSFCRAWRPGSGLLHFQETPIALFSPWVIKNTLCRYAPRRLLPASPRAALCSGTKRPRDHPTHGRLRQGPVYELALGKGSPKLKPLQDGSCTPVLVGHPLPPPASGQHYSRNLVSPSSVNIEGGTLSMLAGLLGLILDRPVIDKTGLTNYFAIQMWRSWGATVCLARERGNLVR